MQNVAFDHAFGNLQRDILNATDFADIRVATVPVDDLNIIHLICSLNKGYARVLFNF